MLPVEVVAGDFEKDFTFAGRVFGGVDEVLAAEVHVRGEAGEFDFLVKGPFGLNFIYYLSKNGLAP